MNLYALAFVLESLLGIPLAIAIIASALFVLSYILLGGLSSAIYNEVMQFFVILLALIPVIIVVLKETGGIHGLFSKLATQGASFTHPWNGTSLGGHNPFGDWIGIVFGLGFCLSFAYWTTNFVEVQRGMSAKDESSARLTPIVAAYPKVIIPLGTVIPGMAAILLIPGLGTAGGLTYNDAIPALYNKYLPLGVLGVAVTGLLAAFMAGMAANVSSFNAVWTYDIWQNYIRPGRPDRYYLRVGGQRPVPGGRLGSAGDDALARAGRLGPCRPRNGHQVHDGGADRAIHDRQDLRMRAPGLVVPPGQRADPGQPNVRRGHRRQLSGQPHIRLAAGRPQRVVHRVDRPADVRTRRVRARNRQP